MKSADQQVRINAGLFDASHDSLRQLNEVAARVNAIDGDVHTATTLLHKALIIINSQVGELTQACQLAKSGIVNSRLLLPATLEGKQVMLRHDKVAVSNEETYAVVNDCLSIGNTTVCPEKSLKMDENSCVPKLLKGGQARCEFLRNNEARVGLVEDGMMFLSNFNGTLEAGPNTHNLNGTYIVQFANETISVAGRTYTSYSSSHFVVMPAILTTVTATGYAPSLHYVNDFNMENFPLSPPRCFYTRFPR